MKHAHLNRTRGQIILLTLVFFAIFLVVSSSMVTYVTSFARAERYGVMSAQALALAEAGIDKAAYSLNQNGSYSGEANTALGPGVFTISVATIDAGTKQVTATGYVPNSATPKAVKTVTTTMTVNTSIVSFRFGVQVGTEGVTMGNGSQIIGNLFSNGSIVGGGSNGEATITGDATVAGGTQATPDAAWTVQNADKTLGDVASRANLAQSFKPITTAVLNKVKLNLRKVGSPGDITLKIVTDNGGEPSKTVLATGSLPASSVAGSYSLIDGTFTTTPTLTAGQTYWIIAIASVSASNYFVWGMHDANAYPDGYGMSSPDWNAGNPAWTLIGGDLGFETYMGGVITSITGVAVGGTAWAHTLDNCNVGGNALYQVITNCTVSGTETSGASPTAPAAMPISDAQIDEWEAIATAGGVISGNYTITGTETLGPVMIDGNLVIDINATINLAGIVWVKGDVTFANNSSLSVDPSTGNSGAIILADSPGNEATKGVVYLANNMSISGNGTAGSFPMILSTNSSASAISMNNNSTSVILYSSAGTINVSNNAAANQITAYKLNLGNNTTITYVNGLQSQTFSNGPGGSWAFLPGSYAIAD